jgi:hypothetical protein
MEKLGDVWITALSALPLTYEECIQWAEKLSGYVPHFAHVLVALQQKRWQHTIAATRVDDEIVKDLSLPMPEDYMQYQKRTIQLNGFAQVLVTVFQFSNLGSNGKIKCWGILFVRKGP